MSRRDSEPATAADSITTRDGYDRWASAYDDADPSTLLDEPLLAALCRTERGCRILDVGCGTGRYLRRIAETGQWSPVGTGGAPAGGAPSRSMVGMDLSFGMLARARRETEASVGHIAWVQASAEYLPFRSAGFNRVLSGLVLDHVSDLAQFFGEIARVLLPRGRAVVSGIHPDMQRLTGPTIRLNGEAGAYCIPGVIHEVNDVLRTAKAAGLTIVECHEPAVGPELIARRPQWRDRLGCPALLILALERRP